MTPTILGSLRSDGIVVLPDLYPVEVKQLGRSKPALPFKKKLEIDHPLGSEFLSLAEAYYGCPARYEAELIVTRPTPGPPCGSQLWHRDHHAGASCLRVMVYLTDVDLNNGPLCYAPGTQTGGARDTGRYDRLADCPAEDWLTITGPRGTTIVFDILGYHRGLKNVSGERRALCFTYAKV